MVDISSHNLHIYCIGKGKPTVVIDVGIGDSYPRTGTPSRSKSRKTHEYTLPTAQAMVSRIGKLAPRFTPY